MNQELVKILSETSYEELVNLQMFIEQLKCLKSPAYAERRRLKMDKKINENKLNK